MAASLLRRCRWLLLAGLFLIFISCSLVNQLVHQAAVQKPRLQLKNVRITALSFQQIDLTFMVEVENPNGMGIGLEGFDYQLEVNQSAFVKGRQDEAVELKANSSSSVEIPLSLPFAELFQTFHTLRQQDSSEYLLACRFYFQVPLLGKIKIPLKKSGMLPLLKIPKISLQGLTLKRLKLGSADMEIALRIDNKNSIPFTSAQLDYQLRVDGKSWISGKTAPGDKFLSNNSRILKIPFTLQFLSVGKSILQLLRGNQPLSYQLTGGVQLDSPQCAFQPMKLPFQQSGSINISR